MQGVRDLARERAFRRRSIDGIAPKVAERAGERALASREKDRQRALDATLRPALVFLQRAVRLPGIDFRLGTAARSDLAVNGRRGHAGAACSAWKCCR